MPRILNKNGLLSFYTDESDDKSTYVMSSIAIPTLTPTPNGIEVSWEDYYLAMREWRKSLKDDFNIPFAKELKGRKLATGRNSYDGGSARLRGMRAIRAYRTALNRLDWLPNDSVMSVAVRGRKLYGSRKLSAALDGLFQRMQRKCEQEDISAMVCLDEGHHEYVRQFRKARHYLKTGSMVGAWPSGHSSANKPFDASIMDAELRASNLCNYTQIADLVAYAVLARLRFENEQQSENEARFGLGDLYFELPGRIVNKNANKYKENDGIVRIIENGGSK